MRIFLYLTAIILISLPVRAEPCAGFEDTINALERAVGVQTPAQNASPPLALKIREEVPENYKSESGGQKNIGAAHEKKPAASFALNP